MVLTSSIRDIAFFSYPRQHLSIFFLALQVLSSLTFLLLNSVKTSESLALLTLLLSACALLGFFFFFGLRGLVAYIVAGTFVANVQVLKIALFHEGQLPLVQGTFVFGSLFWTFDMIVEFYGAKAAYQILWLSFLSFALVTIWMLLTIAMPVSPESFVTQRALEVVFLPAPRLFLASVLAYLVSQSLDIWIFSGLARVTSKRFLGARGFFSSAIATMVDHLLFSWLAWRLFAAEPVPWPLFWQTYVLTGYGLRLILALGSPVLLYAGRAVKMYAEPAIREG